jgi:hypothetical protein
MDRRAFVTGLGALLAAPFVAEAQRAAKVLRVGVLSPGPAPPLDPFDQRTAFEAALRDFGWIPGTSVAIAYRYAEDASTASGCRP